MYRPTTTPAPPFRPLEGSPLVSALAGQAQDSTDSQSAAEQAHLAGKAAVKTLCARAHAAALASLPSPVEAPGLNMADWDDLLCAVKTRLRLAAVDGGGQDTSPAFALQTRVLDCVAALDQLHTMLAREMAHRRQTDRAASDARMARERSLAELGVAQADELRVRHLVSHDSLTTLPSGAFFLERLDHALAYAEPQHRALAVLHIDLDGFRAINDAHGRAAGDELLKIVAMRLTRAVRCEDMVSRLRGDEFACMVAGVPSREGLGHFACKLFDTISAPLKIGKLRLTLHPSIGIATCPADGVTAEDLLRRAGEAMRRARRHLSGYAFCDH